MEHVCVCASHTHTGRRAMLRNRRGTGNGTCSPPAHEGMHVFSGSALLVIVHNAVPRRVCTAFSLPLSWLKPRSSSCPPPLPRPPVAQPPARNIFGQKGRRSLRAQGRPADQFGRAARRGSRHQAPRRRRKCNVKQGGGVERVGRLRWQRAGADWSGLPRPRQRQGRDRGKRLDG